MRNGRAWLLSLLVVTAVGCGGNKDNVPNSCREFIATMDKLAACPKLPESGRAMLQKQISNMKTAVKSLEDSAGEASADQKKMMDDACSTQGDTIRKMYKEVTPECL